MNTNFTKIAFKTTRQIVLPFSCCSAIRYHIVGFHKSEIWNLKIMNNMLALDPPHYNQNCGHPLLADVRYTEII